MKIVHIEIYLHPRQLCLLVKIFKSSGDLSEKQTVELLLEKADCLFIHVVKLQATHL